MKRPANRPSPAERPLSAHLALVHPAPETGHEVLALATHLLHQFATTQGKELPGFSVDAARFLVQQRWDTRELAHRVWHAVETNAGSLITAADLSEPASDLQGDRSA